MATKSQGRKLPEHYTRKARAAATFIEPYRDLSNEDRTFIVKMKLQGWFDNGEGLNDYRWTGSAESVENYANDLYIHGVPYNSINIISAGDGNFSIYASRDSG